MATIFLVTLLRLFGSCLGGSPAEGDNNEYWHRWGSVVLADVVDCEKVEHGRDIIHVRPCATLSGRLDAALYRELSVSTRFDDLQPKKKPAKGAKVLMVIEHCWDKREKRALGYSSMPDTAAFFPQDEHQQRPCLFEIKRFDDAKVDWTIETLRTLRGEQRHKVEKQPVEISDFDRNRLEDEPPEWKNSAVAYVDVTGYDRDGSGSPTVRIRPIATLTGNFDSAYVGEIDAEIHFGDKSAVRERPHIGAKALVLLKRDEAGKYSIPDTPVDYFPADDHGNHPAYFEVIGFDNEDVDKVIENLRALRAEDREALEKKPSAADGKPPK